MAHASKEKVLEALLEQHGESFCGEAGISIADRPAPLFQLLVLSTLCGAPVRVSAAVNAARALFIAGWTAPDKMARATTARRTEVLREAGYARFVARAARSLGDSAAAIARDYGGDLRKLRAEAGADPAALRKMLKSLAGVGDTAVDVYFAEVQGTWDEVAPFAGARALEMAAALGLAKTPAALAELTSETEFPTVVAALTRCALAGDAGDVVAAARAR